MTRRTHESHASYTKKLDKKYQKKINGLNHFSL